jgi:hypothetical protein
MTPVCHFHLAGPEPGLSLLCENGFLDETVFEEKKKCILDIRSLEKSISRKRQQHLLQQLYRVSLQIHRFGDNVLLLVNRKNHHNHDGTDERQTSKSKSYIFKAYG